MSESATALVVLSKAAGARAEDELVLVPGGDIAVAEGPAGVSPKPCAVLAGATSCANPAESNAEAGFFALRACVLWGFLGAKRRAADQAGHQGSESARITRGEIIL
jgi:hypothetical protein